MFPQIIAQIKCEARLKFVASPEILVLKINGNFRLTRHPRHEDFSVWDGGRIIAQGGKTLTERIFEERTA